MRAIHGTSRPIDQPHFHLLTHIPAFVVHDLKFLLVAPYPACHTRNLFVIHRELVGKGIFYIPCHSRWAIYLQHQLMVFVTITRVTVHLVNTIAGSTRIQGTWSSMISHAFPCSLLPSGNQKCNRNCHQCAHRQAHPPLDQGTVFAEPPLFLNWLVFGVVPSLSHRQFCLQWSGHHFLHDLMHRDNDCLFHGALLNAVVAQLPRFPQWWRGTLPRSQIRRGPGEGGVWHGPEGWGPSGCPKPRRPARRRGFHTTTWRRKQAHLRFPPSKTPPKFHDKTSERKKTREDTRREKRHKKLPRERKKEWKWEREKEKKARNFWRSRGGRSRGGRFFFFWELCGMKQVQSLWKCGHQGNNRESSQVEVACPTTTTLQANKLPQRLNHVDCTWRMTLGAPWARCLARGRRNCAVRLQLPALCSSGYVLSLRCLASWSTPPPLTEVPRFAVPSLCSGEIGHRQTTATRRRWPPDVDRPLRRAGPGYRGPSPWRSQTRVHPPLGTLALRCTPEQTHEEREDRGIGRRRRPDINTRNGWGSNRATPVGGNRNRNSDAKGPWWESHNARSGSERVGHTVNRGAVAQLGMLLPSANWSSATAAHLRENPQVVLPQRCPPKVVAQILLRGGAPHNPCPSWSTKVDRARDPWWWCPRRQGGAASPWANCPPNSHSEQHAGLAQHCPNPTPGVWQLSWHVVECDEATPNSVIMPLSERQWQVLLDHAQQIGASCSTEQQQQPRCLEVLHSRDSLKQQLVIHRLRIQLIHNVERVADRSSQDTQPILGQWQLRITLPHHCVGFRQTRSKGELLNPGGLRPTPVPELGLPVVNPDGALPRLDVVNKSRRCRSDLRRASRHLATWRSRRLEQRAVPKWKEMSPNLMNLSHLMLPYMCWWSSVQLSNERRDLVPNILQQSLQHGVVRVGQQRKGLGPESQKNEDPKGGALKGGRLKISRFFFPFPPPFRSFCLSLGVLSLVVFEALGLKCARGVLGLSSETPAASVLKMSGFTPYWILAFFWAALLKMSVFYPTRNFRQFWADPTFWAVKSTFLAKEEAHSVEILPHRKFWPFLSSLKDVRFYPILNFGHFGAPSLVTLFDLPKHPKTPQTPEALNTLNTLKTLNTWIGISRVLFPFVLLSGGLPSAHPKIDWPSFLTLWKVKGEGGGAKNGQNSLWGKNIEKTWRPKNGQNSIWGKTGHL